MLAPEKKFYKVFTFGPHLFTAGSPTAVHCRLSRPPFV